MVYNRKEEKGGDYMAYDWNKPIVTVDDVYRYYDACCADPDWQEMYEGRSDDFELACSCLWDDLRNMYANLFPEED